MLYKNNSESLDMSLFKNPTAEYRAAPFWAWNCELDEKELLWQIEQLKLMGFGGFFMHTRSGMSTEYLSDGFMKLVKGCVEKAKSESMNAYLYDEDRWPSGAAGGKVTQEPKYRQRRLLFTEKKLDSCDKAEAIKGGKSYLIGIYDIILNEKGELREYKRIKSEEEARGYVRYAYCQVYSSFNKSPGWYNGQTYVDTMNKEAMEKFVEITHERYKECVGDDFGKAVPTIFTDEPQYSHWMNLPIPESTYDAAAPWTIDIEESFKEAYGYDITDKIPELFWELENGAVSVARYNFHDHACERFVSAFSDTIGKWCDKNNIALTGHLFGEYMLAGQARYSGEAMRNYRSFQIPGVDMLFDYKEYSTVKQAQSAARQYGREGVMSECYGVTNWDFDFRGHKAQGDWQAALGVTLRVPHLSWVSMKGAAKRDYPASINYQSPWYKEYSYIENHFARLSTVLTRGKPCVNVGVIHPIESYWIKFGPETTTGPLRESIDENFENLIKWLLFETIDFDLISESSLREIGSVSNEKFNVGKMEYSVIIIPSCITLKETTLELLEKFSANGGRIIFLGDKPEYVDGLANDRIDKLYEKSEKASFDRFAVSNALKDERVVEIKNIAGKNPDQFIYQLRHDSDADYLFIANAKPFHNNIHNYSTEPPRKCFIRIKGGYAVSVLNTFTGEEEIPNYKFENGHTAVYYEFYENDSLLLKLVPCEQARHYAEKQRRTMLSQTDFKRNVSYILEEDNVCLFDLAEYSLDGGGFEETEEILRIDKKLRERFGWPQASGQDMQPWAMGEIEKSNHFITLRFTFNSKENFKNLYFCAEELLELCVNGEKISLCESGYYVDKSIKKYPIPEIVAGENVILAKVPFEKHLSLEACYLVGDFGVELSGCEKTLIKSKEKIGFGDIVSQGMPFYSGNVTYKAKINVPEECDVCINTANYKGHLVKVKIDGQDAGNIVFAPYDLYVNGVSAGEHTVEFTLFGNRHNTFGGLHNCGISIYYGQGYWYSTENSWSYEYNLKPSGILKSPVITMYKNL